MESINDGKNWSTCLNVATNSFKQAQNMSLTDALPNNRPTKRSYNMYTNPRNSFKLVNGCQNH